MISPLFFILFLAFFGPVFAEGEATYSATLKRDLRRGLLNTFTAPAEIGIGLFESHERKGWPFVRHACGAVEGSFHALSRMTSGLWDLTAAVLPGEQKKIPLEPDTYFD